jgi:superfamily II DNA or RNA helicase/HKD family nuclease
MARILPEGIYEDLVTREVADALDRLPPTRADVGLLDLAELSSTLAKHFGRELERALRSLKEDDQVSAIEALLLRLGEVAPETRSDDARIVPPPRRLEAVYRSAAPLRPTTPLSSSTLLTRNRAEPALGHELSREIGSADALEMLSAFITLGGVRVVRDALERFARRGGKLRVLTTVFTGTTEVEAVDALARLEGAEVRISYDIRRTRLHAKAWLFERNSNLHTAYVGSANLTATALGTGHEWMVKACAADLPHVIDKFRGTFESLWNDGEFEPYDPKSEADRTRLGKALRAERPTGTSSIVQLFTLRPFPFQEEILDRLGAERTLHLRYRNLVVAATGTGKTVIAAFDYARYAQRAGTLPRLLFLAHRRELLDQARTTFRHVLSDAAFGELLGDGETPERWEHVFAMVQTAANGLADRVGAEHFRFVVLDECHHAPADSYQRVIRYLNPEILLGLTATPERADGKSLLPDFGGRIAADLRLWHALERQLLVPFEYYGVSDGTDLTRIRWTRTGYAASELASVYTGNEARVDLVIAQLQRRVMDLRSVRALAFCVSVEHAEFMARALSARGVSAMAVHGGSTAEERENAPKLLSARDVNVLCTCDLYNEGVDLPFVDTLLLLRPTSSATIFLQQIGRGLRVHPGKSTCLVLDFIGQHHAEFRFDELYGALTGIPRAKLVNAVEDEFPFLPSGCVLDLDLVARERVLSSIKRVLPTNDRLVRELREFGSQGTSVSLKSYLEATGREVEDVYRAGGWTPLLAQAGLKPAVDEETADLSRRLGWLLHTDEPARLRAWASEKPDDYERRMTMLDFQLHHRGVLREPAATRGYIASRPAIREELSQLAQVLEDRIALAIDVYPIPEWPLALHRHYARREIVAAIGFVKAGDKGKTPQGGIIKLESERREILLVTLDKSSASFSPTTRYRDYAISRTVFHWETQTIASASRPSGRRYIESPGNGWSFYLFVRTDSDATYAFLGPARIKSHVGDRPIAITWDLERAMPAVLLEQFATLAQG